MTLLYPEVDSRRARTNRTDCQPGVGLAVEGGGHRIAWKRDSVNMYAFHLEISAAGASLDVTFDFISHSESEGFSSGSSATSELAVLNWSQLVLYPEGAEADSLQYQATLPIPGHAARARTHGARERRCPFKRNPATRSSFSQRRGKRYVAASKPSLPSAAAGLP